MTDGRRQIDTEKQALVLSLFSSNSFRLASEPRQTLVIIPCQLAFQTGQLLPFFLSRSFSFPLVVAKADAR